LLAIRKNTSLFASPPSGLAFIPRFKTLGFSAQINKAHYKIEKKDEKPTYGDGR